MSDCDDHAGVPTWYLDADKDGHGAPSGGIPACDAPTGRVAVGDDCADNDPHVHPGAVEVCGNFVDDDCDGGPGSCVLPPVVLGSAHPPGWRGAVAGDPFGRAIAGAGDLDGDGRDDLVVGASNATRGVASTGGVYVISGATVGDALSTSVDPGLAFWRGDKSYDAAGTAVDAIGDLDGDGRSDLIVGAYAYDVGPKLDAGAVYILSGAARGTSTLSVASTRLFGEIAYDNAGYAVSRAGDVDGDGRPDVVSGAFGADDAGLPGGAAYVVFAPAPGTRSLATANAKLLGASDGDQAGRAVSGGGDFDGDGLSDLIIGAPQADVSSRGAAYVVTSVPTGVSSLADADLTLIGAAYGALTGSAVAMIGDVDQDGMDDVLVGAYGENASYIVFGGQIGRVNLRQADVWLFGPDASDAGKAVGAAGDLDRDGGMDVIIGGPRAASRPYASEGFAWIVVDPAASAVVDLVNDARVHLIGAANYDETGFAVAGVGDVDGDGFDDVAIGAPGWDQPATYQPTGTVYLVRGTGLECYLRPPRAEVPWPSSAPCRSSSRTRPRRTWSVRSSPVSRRKACASPRSARSTSPSRKPRASTPFTAPARSSASCARS